jgi:ubiquinone biosynthesis protein UbiJ
LRPFGLGPGALGPALVNLALESEGWAQACLAVHADRTFEVAIGPATTRMQIDAAGRVQAASRDDAAPDLTLTLSPFSVASFLARPARWDELVVADGDPALAATLKGLAETLPWFVERALAGALGPIVGQRVADAGRKLLALPEYAAASIGQNVERYAREETDLAVRRSEAEAFGIEVAGIAARVDEIAMRMDAMAARLTLEGRASRSA